MYTAHQWKNKGNFITSSSSAHVIFYIDLIQEEASYDDTLTILHGFPESSFSFHKVIDDLSLLFKRIILVDFIGFGYSSKPSSGYAYSIGDHANVAMDVLVHLQIVDTHLLCHDMGDTVGTELLSRQVAGEFPDEFIGFKSVIFTNGSMAIEHASLRITQKILLTGFGFMLSKLTSQRLFTHQLRSAHGNDHLTRSDIESLWAQLNIKGGRQILHMLIRYYKDRMRYEASRYLPALSEVGIPIFFCWGRDDQVARLPIPYDIQERYCPDATVIEVPDMGHFGQLGEPEIWTKYIVDIYRDVMEDVRI